MSKKLREWQKGHLAAAIAKSLEHINGHADPIWLSQAVTGAGKTTFGVEAALRLFDDEFCRRNPVPL